MNKKNIALIDIGSNSIRLVIFKIDERGYYKEIQNLKVVARLSSYIDENGYLTNDGISKLLQSLKYFQEVTRTYEISKIKCVATAAIRQAKNQDEILNKVNAMTDFSIRILSEYEEAFFGYLAVTNSTNIKNGVTIDIGGGSTEVTLFKDRKLIHFHSFPFGAITLKQRFIENEIPTQEEKERLKTFLREQFQSLNWLYNSNMPLIGIGGSARNLSLVHQRKYNYQLRGLHQYEMSFKSMNGIAHELKNMSFKERQMVEGLSKDRADIIIPAAEAICTLMEVTKAPQFIMSNKGLRDGLFYEELFLQLNIENFPSVVEESFYQLNQEYEININHVKYLSNIVNQLYHELKDYFYLTLTEDDLRLLLLSCRVLYIGEFINHETSSENTFYLLTNKTIEGLTHHERLKISLIASFKSKNVLHSYIENFKNWFTEEEVIKLELLGAMLKFSYALNLTRRELITKVNVFEFAPKDELKLSLTYNSEPYFEQAKAQKYKKHLERVLKKRVDIMFRRLH